jgi:hypothetical protein
MFVIILSGFNLNRDSEILCNIIRNYIAEHGLYLDVYSLTHEHGIKNYLNIHALRIYMLL